MYTTERNHFWQTGLSLVLALVVLPLFMLAGCDSNDDDDNGQPPVMDDNGNGGNNMIDVQAGLYDTMLVDGDTTVLIREQNEGGIIPANSGSSEITWTSNYEWIMDGRTFVNEGQTLNIEPGTVVKGRSRTDPNLASVLVVARGGTINADGTAENPIIFTAEDDDVSDPDDLPENLDGAWGGVIIIGRAPTNNAGNDVNVEGIPTSETRAQYGGSDPNDNSGVFRYVSIRYGGVSIGAGNEINGLTMYSVGDGTTIEFVEVFNNRDDGFEWFGGTVNTRYLLASRVGDDSFDIDQGFSGTNQFFLAIQAQGRGDRTAEHDGGDEDLGPNGECSEPFATPQIYNATYIGSGAEDGESDIALKLRDCFAGAYFNSVFFDFPNQLIEIEDLDGTQPDSRGRFLEGNLRVENSIFWNFGAVEDGATGSDIFVDLVENEGDFGNSIATYLQDNNRYVDPQITRSGVIPPAGSPAATGAAALPMNDFLMEANYLGAFAPGGDNWAAGWSFSDEIGLFDGMAQ